jgi:hypothetical protein
MSATRISKTIEDTVRVLEELKDAVEAHKVHLKNHMFVGITDKSRSFAISQPDKNTGMDYEVIGTIGDASSRSIIIYESTIMHDCEFAVYDEYADICLIITIDDVIFWTSPSSGDDPAENDQLKLLAANARLLMR